MTNFHCCIHFFSSWIISLLVFMISIVKLHFHSNEFLLREIVYSDSQYLCTCINQKTGDWTIKGVIFVHSLFH